MYNYVNWNNESVTNAINAVAAAGEPLWEANYSTFLTHISWSNIINGTIWSWVMNGTLFQTSQWNATNESYLTEEALWNANYSQFLLNNESIKPHNEWWKSS